MFVAYILVFISLGFIWAFWKMSCSFLFNMILLFLAWLWDHMRITCIVLAITMVLGVVFTVFSIGWRDQYHELFYEGSAFVRHFAPPRHVSRFRTHLSVKREL